MREFRGQIGGQPWVGWFAETAADLEDFREWVQRNNHLPIAMDTETLGLDLYKDHGRPFVRLAQFGTEDEAWVVPVEYGDRFREAARWVVQAIRRIVGHNFIGFDAPTIARHMGLDLQDIIRKTRDTLIMAKLVDPRQQQDGWIGHSLKAQSAHYLDPSAPDTQGDLTQVFRSLKLTKATGWAGIELTHPTYLEYACLDVILASRLLPVLQGELDRLGVRPELVAYEHRLARMCAVMSDTGMVLDHEYTETLSAGLEAEAEKWTAVAARYGVTSVNSPRQLVEAFQAMGETWTEKTDSGAPAVGKNVLLRFADLNRDLERLGTRTPNPLAEAVYHAKRAGKWRSTYATTFLDTVDSAGRIHPGIQTLEARTGRMSITRPAVQTLPSGDQMIRRCLMADEGHVIVSTDFAAIELRVLAALADVRRMKDAIQAGEDLHDFTARLVFGDGFTKKHRKISKGISFGKVYGGGAQTIAAQTGAPIQDIQRALKTYENVYPEISRAANRWQRQAYDNGMVLVSPTGRRLPLDRDRTYAATNYMCQSTARDVLGQAMCHMEDRGLLPYLRLPIHDEVLASVPAEDAQDIAREIESCMTFELYGVPIQAEAEIGKRSWGSLYGSDF